MFYVGAFCYALDSLLFIFCVFLFTKCPVEERFERAKILLYLEERNYEKTTCIVTRCGYADSFPGRMFGGGEIPAVLTAGILPAKLQAAVRLADQRQPTTKNL